MILRRQFSLAEAFHDESRPSLFLISMMTLHPRPTRGRSWHVLCGVLYLGNRSRGLQLPSVKQPCFTCAAELIQHSDTNSLLLFYRIVALQGYPDLQVTSKHPLSSTKCLPVALGLRFASS